MQISIGNKLLGRSLVIWGTALKAICLALKCFRPVRRAESALRPCRVRSAHRRDILICI